MANLMTRSLLIRMFGIAAVGLAASYGKIVKADPVNSPNVCVPIPKNRMLKTDQVVIPNSEIDRREPGRTGIINPISPSVIRTIISRGYGGTTTRDPINNNVISEEIFMKISIVDGRNRRAPSIVHFILEPLPQSNTISSTHVRMVVQYYDLSGKAQFWGEKNYSTDVSPSSSAGSAGIIDRGTAAAIMAHPRNILSILRRICFNFAP